MFRKAFSKNLRKYRTFFLIMRYYSAIFVFFFQKIISYANLSTSCSHLFDRLLNQFHIVIFALAEAPTFVVNDNNYFNKNVVLIWNLFCKFAPILIDMP